MRRALAALLSGVLACSSTPAAAGDDDAALAGAINVAGRQRMLSQRIVKAWCLLGLRNENREPRAQLFDAIERFEAQLAELTGFVQRHPRLRPALEALRARFAALDALAYEEPDRGRALDAHAAAEQVLAAAEGFVRDISALSARSQARIIELSGRQRMLSQRLVGAYALLAWGFDERAVVEQFVGAWSEFEAGLRELMAFSENTPALDTALADAEVQWHLLKSALGLYREGVFFPGIIDDAAEKILLDMENVTHLYERLLAQRTGT